MTLLTTEGFETRAAKDGWAYNTLAYVAGRYGGSAFSTGNCTYALPTPTDVVVIGFALLIPPAPTLRSVVEFYDAATANYQCRVLLRADRYVDLQRGATTVGSSSAPVGAGGDWIWVEVKTRVNDVTGFMEVRVNGAVVASFVGDTVNSTVAGANVGITSLLLNGVNSSAIDDVYVSDTAGAAPFNDYLNDVQVETLVPNGNGASSQFVGSDGNSVDNYLLVDELPAVDSDRVESSTVGQRDVYTFTDPAAGVGEVLAVMPCVAVSKTVAGPANIKIVDRLAGGVERVSAAKPVLNLGWRTAGPYVADASGAAWTPATVASSQFGVEVA